MTSCPRPPALRRQSGIALLEALLAVLILGIGLLGTVGMQARAYQALNDAGARAEATMAAEKLNGIMSTDMANLALYARAAGAAVPARLQAWYTETQASIPGSEIEVDVTPVSGTTRTGVTIAIAWKRQGVRSPGMVTCTTSGTLPAACNRHVITSYFAQAS